MRTFLVIALVVMVGGLVLSWIVGRFSSRHGSHISLTTGLVARVAVVVVMFDLIPDAVDRGGWFVALALLFGLIAAGSVFAGLLVAAALWLSLSGSNDRLNG